jgi:hypothetical protein
MSKETHSMQIDFIQPKEPKEPNELEYYFSKLTNIKPAKKKRMCSMKNKKISMWGWWEGIA